MKWQTLFFSCLLPIVTGCALNTGMHPPSMDTVILLRDSGIAPLNVGDFRLADGVDPSIDRSLLLRSNQIKPHSRSSFALDLREAMIEDLKAAGRYDPA